MLLTPRVNVAFSSSMTLQANKLECLSLQNGNLLNSVQYFSWRQGPTVEGAPQVLLSGYAPALHTNLRQDRKSFSDKNSSLFPEGQ